jgi:sugar/nucleoside kinase (ribokinase family)
MDDEKNSLPPHSPLHSPELLCIGNALADVFAEGEEDIDIRFGLDKPVQHTGIDLLHEIIALLPRISIVSGGGAANVAKVAGLLGLKAGFIGAAGSAPAGGGLDRFGVIFEKDLTEAGVSVCLVRKPPPTGICLMLRMPDGRSRIAASPSAALELAPQDIDETLIQKAKVVMIDGFMLNRKNLIRHILQLANKHGTVAALDAGSAGLAEGEAWEIATYARLYPLILFMNEAEALAFYRALSGKAAAGNYTEDVLSHEAEEFFSDFTAKDLFPVVAVKLGKRGALVFAGGGVYREGTIPLVPLEPTGAGDAFCAAFLGAWIRGKPLSECAGLGNKAAREVLNVHGTQVNPKKLKSLAKQLRN